MPSFGWIGPGRKNVEKFRRRAIRFRGFLQTVPILVGVIVGCAVAAICGMLDPQSIARVEGAPWVGLPSFQAPVFSWGALAAIAPIFVVLVAENKGHIAAISDYMGRDLITSRKPCLGEDQEPRLTTGAQHAFRNQRRPEQCP